MGAATAGIPRTGVLAEPMLIIAGSRMCTGGRIVSHLKELLPRPQTCVLFVGHQARGTPGRAMQQPAGATVRPDGEDMPGRAHVDTLSARLRRLRGRRW